MEEYLSLTAETDGERVDAFLSRRAPGLSRSAAQKLLESGSAAVEGRSVKKNYLLRAGETVTVFLPPPEDCPLVAQDIPLDIVYEDEMLIVVNKPRGMVVHPAAGHPDGTLVNALLFHCGESLRGVGGEKRPGIVHRIDMDTSGLLAVAKCDAAHQSLSAQLADHSMFRVYEAVVYGHVKADSGTVDAPIARHPTDRKRMAVVRQGGREAITHWEVLERYRDYSHLRCRLETGRTHQIRVHMEHIGHPLAGDLVYGRKRPDKGLAGQCLHARELELSHPADGRRLRFRTELPGYFTEFLAKLGPVLWQNDGNSCYDAPIFGYAKEEGTCQP